VRDHGFAFLDHTPSGDFILTNEELTTCVSVGLGVCLTALAPAVQAARGALRCHVCGAAIDPGEPSAHLSSSCFQGLYTRRHDYVQRFGAAPILRQLPGRPTVQQNVTGTHGASTEMDIVCSETTGVAGSLPLFVDVCVTDPTTKSNLESGAARVPGCSAATRYNAKIRHYGLNPGGTPKIDTSAREFLPWVVESFGRVHPALDDWLRRRAADAAAHAESTIGEPTGRQLERSRAVAGATHRHWRGLLSCSIARAQGRHIAEALSRCVRSERDADPPHPELYSGAAAADMDAPTSLCDFASSAAARSAATLRMPRHAGSLGS